MYIYFFYEKEKKNYIKKIRPVNRIEVSPISKPYPFLLKHYYCFYTKSKSFEKHKRFVSKNNLKTILETN